MIRLRRGVVGLVLTLAPLGCGAEGNVNRSPTAGEAPDRLTRAQEQAEAVDRANSQAEKAFLRGTAPPES